MKFLWIKWFPTDWLSDGELSKTSLLGRGLWIEALNAMYNSDTYALSGSPDELSRVLRCSVAEFHTALNDLQRHNAAKVEVRNGLVTLVSRRLEREHKKRKQGALRVSKHREKQVCNAISVSASVSVSESPPKEKGGSGEKGRNVTLQMQAEIGKHFNRRPDDRWSCEEEYLLAEVCKRQAVESEWIEIIQFRRLAAKQGDKMRETVKSLLENWQGELDRARKVSKSPIDAEARARAERSRRLLG